MSQMKKCIWRGTGSTFPSDKFQFHDMFPLTKKSAKIRGYVPETRLADRQKKWILILFPRATLRSSVYYHILEERGLKKPEIQGFPSPGADRPRRDGNPLLCSPELVQKQGRGYDFTISENESTILLFWAKRENDFTIWGRSRL